MHGLAAGIYNQILQVLPCHAIKRCYGIQAAPEVSVCMPAANDT